MHCELILDLEHGVLEFGSLWSVTRVVFIITLVIDLWEDLEWDRPVFSFFDFFVDSRRGHDKSPAVISFEDSAPK